MWIRAFAAVVALVAACSFAVPLANATPDTVSGVTAWFQQGRCPAFNGPYKPEPPFARNTNEQLDWMSPSTRVFHPSGNPSYLYDSKHGVAFRAIGGDSYGSVTIRRIGPPPSPVQAADLGHVATTSGIRLGTSAATVIAKMGQPRVLDGCGLQRYAYLVDKDVGGNALEFTIQNGTVVEIFREWGD
jgi:hypothetical protein